MATEAKRNKVGWYFLIPITVLLAVFLLYPILYSIYLTFTSKRGLLVNFVGFANYAKLFKDPMFIKALTNTLKILLIQVPIMLILALVFAALLNSKHIKFKGFFRTCLFLPSVTSLIAYIILFKMLFDYNGMINDVLLALGLIKDRIPWGQSPGPATFVLIIAMIWRWTGYNMIFYLSAMQNISGNLYEAAEIDGCSPTKSFFSITLPLLKPMILFTTVMSTIGTLQLFDEPMNLSAGGTTAALMGPDNCYLTLSVYIYNLCFHSVPKFGYAATVSYAILIIVAILTFLQFRFTEGEEKKLERRARRIK